jgi:hypothetical protein
VIETDGRIRSSNGAFEVTSSEYFGFEVDELQAVRTARTVASVTKAALAAGPRLTDRGMALISSEYERSSPRLLSATGREGVLSPMGE